MSETETRRHKLTSNGKFQAACLLICPILVFLISLCIGRYYIPIPDLIKIIASAFWPVTHTWSPTMTTVVFDVRLPRLIIVALVGASLSLSGASFQGILKNPLVSPDILGVAAGAGFGAAVAILLSLNASEVQLFAFIFAMVAVGLTYGIHSLYKGSSILILVLCGIIVGSFFSSLVSLTKYVADPENKLPAIVFWLLGSFANVTTSAVIKYSLPMILGIVVLLLLRWRVNVLSLEDTQAKALGLNVKRYQGVIIFFATLITASAVCVSGLISWIGLIVPHMARMIVGPNNSKVLPASILIGASYLMIIDDIARTVVSNEIPIGILTATVGAPFFGYLLLRQKAGWS